MQSHQNRVGFIYVLDDPITGLTRYVGQTFNPKSRLYFHIYEAKNRPDKKGRRQSWIKHLLNNGSQPVMTIMEEIPSASMDQVNDAEIFWIETLRFYGCDLTNMNKGGQTGYINEAGRKKLSGIGVKRKHSPETIAKISAASKSNMTEAAKEHLRQINLESGFRHTEETKQLIAAAKIGKKRPAHVNAALQAGRLAWLEERRANASI